MDGRMYWILVGGVLFLLWPVHPFITSPMLVFMLLKPISLFSDVETALYTGLVAREIPDYMG